jgi:hypothetical protein
LAGTLGLSAVRNLARIGRHVSTGLGVVQLEGKRSARVIQHQLMGHVDIVRAKYLHDDSDKKSNVPFCVIDRLGKRGRRKIEETQERESLSDGRAAML